MTPAHTDEAREAVPTSRAPTAVAAAVPAHRRCSRSARPILAAAVIATISVVLPAGLSAAATTSAAIPGRCAYAEPLVRSRQQTVLVLCDSVTIDRDDTLAIIDFRQRSWGSKARITGEVADDRLSTSSAAIAGRSPVAASGTCRMDHRSDGRLSGVRCLLKTGSRWYAASFIASRL
ncbi:hypothetical protein ASE75_07975 [Sphingomonas sp. Leaf17]|uniref:hypothetical protein n=1 Tax=Sphingomonas sp. Leaf17 TaxID=1735683 RepID=UPI000701B085|nr:hypothetical protein [Sphingomonas sp. Leaf17]KQM64986.1 hypothetical protein ASE75_07975 [Sphingomonas sp. Leaf17]